MVALKQVVYAEANAMPVRGELLEALSWVIAKEVESGAYVGFANTARTNYTFGLCAEPPLSVSNAQFGVKDLGAPIVLLWLHIGALSLPHQDRALHEQTRKGVEGVARCGRRRRSDSARDGPRRKLAMLSHDERENRVFSPTTEPMNEAELQRCEELRCMVRSGRLARGCVCACCRIRGWG